MAFRYRDYLSLLKERDQLFIINKNVDTAMELAEVTDRQASLPNGGKAILFENTGTAFAIVTNQFSSERRIADAFGVAELDEAVSRLESFLHTSLPVNIQKSRFRHSPLQELAQYFPRKSSIGACQEIAMFPPDLNRIPFLRNRPFDEAYTLTNGQAYIKNTALDTYHICSTRIQWHSKSTVQIRLEPSSVASQLIHSDPSTRVPIAVCFGGDPLFTLSSLFPLRTDFDALLFAGYMRKRAVTTVPCLSQPIEVPESSDLVLEGYIDKNETLLDSVSCGEHTGYYSMGSKEPLMHVTCITHRKDPVIPQFIPGITLLHSRGVVSKVAAHFHGLVLKQTITPEIDRFITPTIATWGNFAIVSIDKSYTGQAYKVAHTLWGFSLTALNKVLVVVDKDADMRSMEKLNQVLLQCYNPATDTFFSRGPLSLLDHAAPQNGFGGKICLDATYKKNRKNLDRKFPPRTQAIFFYRADDETNPESASPDSLIYIKVDSHINLSHKAMCMWQAISHADAIRDIRLTEGKLYVDATTKRQGGRGVIRPWPNVSCSSAETIELVNQNWERYLIGDPITSPSLRYQSLLRGNQPMISTNNTEANNSQQAKDPARSPKRT